MLDEQVFKRAASATGFTDKGADGDRLRLFLEAYLSTVSHSKAGDAAIVGAVAAAKALRMADPSMSKAASLLLGKAAADAVLAVAQKAIKAEDERRDMLP